jgi:hypothetical protein
VIVLKEIIAKKDGEIDRLQTMRVVTSEIVSGLEKGRPKTGDHLLKPPTVDIKQQSLRRPTSVIREQKEVSNFHPVHPLMRTEYYLYDLIFEFSWYNHPCRKV